MPKPLLIVCTLVAFGVLLSGCRTKDEAVELRPDYTRPLDPGENALREVRDPARFRALLESAHASNDALLIEAARRSDRWFEKPSAKTHFPIAGVSFERADESVDEMLKILEKRPARDAFVREIMDKFTLYESVGWDGHGTVLYTGYYAPEFEASREPSGEFLYPLYKRPADLVTDPKTGKPLGRQVGSSVEPYPTRREIDESGMLAGTELVWVKSPMDAYIIHVNGSAKLRLTDGSTMYIGYAGKTDRPYKGLGQTMIERDKIPAAGLNLTAVREYYDAHPEETLEMIYENESYVFFTTYPADSWPAGSLGFRVTEKRSLATDKAIFPRGGMLIVETRIPNYRGELRPFTQMMLDQDTGGAIKAPGRGDIFMGQGAAAELLAGRQYQEGRLYYLFLKE
ncbi:MAG: murein transglycosylase A [Phycisphaerales bacterium]